MSGDFEKALARVQTDYAFYIECQTNPDAALEGYDLSPQERATLTDPQQLADLLIRGVKITISGTHDWVNRAAPTKRKSMDDTEHRAKVAAQAEAVKDATTDEEPMAATLKLMETVD